MWWKYRISVNKYYYMVPMESITWPCSVCSLYLSGDRITEPLRAKRRTQIVMYSVPFLHSFFISLLLFFLSLLPPFLFFVIDILPRCDKLWRNWTLQWDLCCFLLWIILRSSLSIQTVQLWPCSVLFIHFLVLFSLSSSYSFIRPSSLFSFRINMRLWIL
jgi:hypothetical protein